MNIFERRGIDLVGASNHVTLRGPLFKSHDTVRSPGVGPGIPPFMMIPTANSDLLRLGQTLKEGTIVLWRCMCRSATKTILMVLGVMAATRP